MQPMTTDRTVTNGGSADREPVLVEPLEAAATEAADAAYAETMVRKGAGTAFASSITTLVIGVGAVIFTVIWPSLASAYITAGVLVVGTVELIWSRRLRQADPKAPLWLALNQLVFLCLITIYCFWQMLAVTEADLREIADSPLIRQMYGDAFDSIFQYKQGRPFVYVFYGLVIALSILFQGGMAYYYRGRRKFVEAYLNQRRPS
jgi:hypothetical protein